MVRSLQLRVNEKTKEFDLGRKGEESLVPDAKERVAHIAEKQAAVEDLTRTMADKLGGSE